MGEQLTAASDATDAILPGRVDWHPVVVGRGKRLITDGGELRRLELIEARPTSSGVVTLSYRPRSA